MTGTKDFDAEAWRGAVPSDWWWVPVVVLGLLASGLLPPTTDAYSLTAGVLVGSTILVWFWPALGAVAAVVVALSLPLLHASTTGRVLTGLYAFAALVLLALRARGIVRQLRLVEAVATQSVDGGPRVLGPMRGRRLLVTAGAVVAIVLAVLTNLVGWDFWWPLLTCVSLVLGRKALAPYGRPDRWAGVPVEYLLEADGDVTVRAPGGGTLFARYLATVPDRMQARASATIWRDGVLVGDIRDGGWAAVTDAGTTLRPLSPTNAIERVARPAGQHRGASTPAARRREILAATVVGIALLIGGGLNVPREWRVATGQGTEGTITITWHVCTGAGKSSDCRSRGDFVGRDGTRLSDVPFDDGDEEVGEVKGAVRVPGVVTIQSIGPWDLFGALLVVLLGLCLGAVAVNGARQRIHAGRARLTSP